MPPARSLEELEEKIRQKLQEAEQPLHVIASESGISKTHLTNFKNSKRNLSFQNLHILAEYFGVKYIIKN